MDATYAKAHRMQRNGLHLVGLSIQVFLKTPSEAVSETRAGGSNDTGGRQQRHGRAA
jgi:hypothetical protein